MALYIEWIGHSSFKISGSKKIYIDPWKVSKEMRDGDIILISHPHHDHFSPHDIKKVAREPWNLFGPQDVVDELGSGSALKAFESISSCGVSIKALPSYTIDKLFHPRRKGWLGYIIIIDGISIYYGGDTDALPEMKDFGPVDIALLPVGGRFTMDCREAATAVKMLKPATTIPYHWGDIIGSRDDAERFAASCDSKTVILNPGELVEISRDYLTRPDPVPGTLSQRYRLWRYRFRKNNDPLLKASIAGIRTYAAEGTFCFIFDSPPKMV